MLEVIVPEGLTISDVAYGKALFANKDFKKDEVVYKNKVSIVGDGDVVQFRAINNDGTSAIHEVDNTHTVKTESGDRLLFTFDAFFNHSCDPNLVDFSLNDDGSEYQMVALRDIQAGEEVTCNYLLFDYECDGHSFDECVCGAANCYKQIRGFKNLPYETQVALLPRVAKEMKKMFLRDHPEYKEEN